MRKLILVRHAKSSWKDTSLPDFERPLNSRGKRDAPLMGRRLVGLGNPPDLILSSPAKRAVSTLNRIVMELGVEGFKIRLEPCLYEADCAEILALARGLDDEVSTVLMVGHNPGLTDFARWLSTGAPENIPTCGVVILELGCDRWQRLCPGEAIVTVFDSPKKVC